MKHIFLPIMFATLTTSSFGAINHKKYKNEVKELNFLENSSQIKTAALRASIFARLIAEESDFDGMVANIDSTFVTKQREVVTEDYNAGASFKIIFGLLGGSAHLSYDTAKLITTNPREVEAFTRIQARDFEKLQNKLRTQMKKKETDMFFAKIFAAKAMQLANKLSFEEMKDIYPHILHSAQQVSNVSFLGFQNITNCLRVDYAKRARGWGFSLTGLIAFSFEENHTQNPYREMNCTSEAIEHSVTEMALNSVDLMLADDLLKEQNRLLQLKIVRDAQAPAFPTWGSPYLQ